MSNDKSRNNATKGFPGGFWVFVLVVVIAILVFPSISNTKSGKVFFSHQVEHLVNLDLLQNDERNKIAQNDNLVTFSGKFRDSETTEGKERFNYLQILNKKHILTKQEETTLSELVVLQQNVSKAAEQFLQLSGQSIPQGGFWVISSLYDTPKRINAVVVKTLSPDGIQNLKSIENTLERVNEQNVDSIGADLVLLVQNFRSPLLGIGNEDLKKELSNLENRLKEEHPFVERVQIYKEATTSLDALVNKLLQEKDGVRLLPLRSVRNYMENLHQYFAVEQALDQNVLELDKARKNVGDVIWFFNNKEVSTRALEKEDAETFASWFASAKEEWEAFQSYNKGLIFRAPDQPRNAVLEKVFKSQEPSPNYLSYIITFLPVLIVIGLLYFMFSRQMKGGVGSSAMNFGKSPARLLTKESNQVTFKDVAGIEECKEELSEIVDFLKEPQKFTKLGAKIPKGVLLVGPPGTGKTLLAKAVAGEANRPFFSISGSDFVEMFVGVGASRVRDLFDQAKRNAPCIIFMDEIDAVGRHRGAGIGGGHDEREQTLNQLLVEMDGFDTKEGVILMAATNRPDILDKALLRPGRFDRRVVLDLPDVKGRYEILKVHARKIKLDPNVDLMDVARNTPGASGADLENILNEAALLAARRGRSAVTSAETIEACDKVRFGKERRSLEMDENEKKTTAFHESGHAIVGLVVKHSDPVDKVTIIPRGFSLGATHFMPKKNRLTYWKKELIDQLAILMGGRVAEEIFVKDASSGAQQDIAQATHIARSMVCEWGMSKDLGLVSYEEKAETGQYLGMNNYHEKNYSEETAQKIDKEVHEILDEAYKRAIAIVESQKDKVLLMADMLMEFETLYALDIAEIMEGKWDVEKKRERLKSADELHKKDLKPKKDKNASSTEALGNI